MVVVGFDVYVVVLVKGIVCCLVVGYVFDVFGGVLIMVIVGVVNVLYLLLFFVIVIDKVFMEC